MNTSVRSFAYTFFVACFVLAGDVARAQVDHADDVCAPTDDPCVVSAPIVVADGTILDFGSRALVVDPGGQIDVGAGDVTILCGSFRMDTAASPGLKLRASTGESESEGGTLEIWAQRRCSGDGDRRCIRERDCDFGGCTSRVCAADRAVRCSTEAECDFGTCDQTFGACTGDFRRGCAIDSDCFVGPCSQVCATNRTMDCSSDADCEFGTCSVGSGTVDIVRGVVNGTSDDSRLILIAGAGDVEIGDRIAMSSTHPDNDGGIIELESGTGSLHVDAPLVATGGEFGTGGEIELIAALDVVVSDSVDADGGDFDGGFIDVDAGRDVFLDAPVHATALVQAGFGGEITVDALRDLHLESAAALAANGHTSDAFNFGGDGGVIELSAGRHVDVAPGVTIVADGADPDGFGGEIIFDADRNATLAGKTFARGASSGGAGGFVEVDVKRALAFPAGALIDVRGGLLGGGGVDVFAGSRMTFGGEIDATTPADGAGDEVNVEVDGPIEMSGVVRISGAPDPVFNGEIEFEFCTLHMAPGARIENAGKNGKNLLRAREHLTIDATAKVLADRATGRNRIVYRNSADPPVIHGLVRPAAPHGDVDATLDPCATCGNGTVESGESCDDGNTAAGDGCNEECQDEDCIAQTPGYPDNELCDDGDGCTKDVCSAGTCLHDLSCDDGVDCTTDTCSPSRECLHDTHDDLCDDGNPCTVNYCYSGGCGYYSNFNPCDDGLSCTFYDYCNEDGVCRGLDTCDDNLNCDAVVNACVECGNGVREGAEECDEAGSSDDCDADCTLAGCGDFYTNTAAGEQCDDGNFNSDTNPNACRTDCSRPGCGDGVVDYPEECDDGNSTSSDLCDGRCLFTALSAADLGCTATLANVVPRHFKRVLNTRRACEERSRSAGGAFDCFGPAGAIGDSRTSLRLGKIAAHTAAVVGKQCADADFVRLYFPGPECSAYAPPDLFNASHLGECVLDVGNELAVAALAVAYPDGTIGDDSTCAVRVTSAASRFVRNSVKTRADCVTLPASGSTVNCRMSTPPYGPGTGDRETDEALSRTWASNLRTPLHRSCTDDDPTLLAYADVCTPTDPLGIADLVGCIRAVDDEVSIRLLDLIAPTHCGDGEVIAPEQCDDANVVSGDGCDPNCTPSACGNGITSPQEACDDGNVADEDGCDSNCTLTGCGNGVVTGGEACDDGNFVEGDGCDSNCTVTGCGNGVTSPDEHCDDGNVEDGDGCSSTCDIEGCGDGVLQDGELCDDHNSASGDGCDSNCTPTGCGNGIRTGSEQCDDGGLLPEDGCSEACVIEFCGDGDVQGGLGEVCDDFNTEDGDGCDSNCTPTGCGNGVVTDGEECDDGAGNSDVEPDACRVTCVLPVCGDDVADSDESCDGTDRGVCPPGNPCDACFCDSTCPGSVEIMLVAADGVPCANNDDCSAGSCIAGRCRTSTRVDTGSTGLDHGSDVNDGVVTRASLQCGEEFPCGVCNVTGIDPSSGNCRCANNNRQLCDEPFAADNDDCGGAVCNCYAGPPVPLSAGNTPRCVVNRFAEDVSGTLDVDTGEGETAVSLRSLIYLGEALHEPCPYCAGDTVPGDGLRSGLCVRGPAEGQTCDAGGVNTAFPGPFGGEPSLDCMPSTGRNVTGTGLRIELAQTTGRSELPISGDVVCGFPPLISIPCWCAQCTGDPSVSCSSHAECAALGLGTCTSFGTGHRPNERDTCDESCEPVDANGVFGRCEPGPDDRFCDGFTRANGEGYIQCLTNADCDEQNIGIPAGSCAQVRRRECFLDPIVAEGSAHPTSPLQGAVYCVGPTGSAGINAVIGLPGPARSLTQTHTTFTCATDPSFEYHPGRGGCP